jgi:hypothetical protein
MRSTAISCKRYNGTTVISSKQLNFTWACCRLVEVLRIPALPCNYTIEERAVLWIVTPCTPLKDKRRFGIIYCLHFQGWRISQARNQHENIWHVELILFTTSPVRNSDLTSSYGSHKFIIVITLRARLPRGLCWLHKLIRVNENVNSNTRNTHCHVPHCNCTFREALINCNIQLTACWVAALNSYRFCLVFSRYPVRISEAVTIILIEIFGFPQPL